MRRTTMLEGKWSWLWLSLLLVLVGLVYVPGLNGPYVLDDGENLLASAPIAMQQLTLTALWDAATSAGTVLLRPLANISFALNYYVAGSFDSSLPFKLVNVFVHLANAVLVYFLTHALTRAPTLRALTQDDRRRVAWFTAALWALHPIQLTNVLYVVQRMNSLAATFVLGGLLLFVHGRLHLADTPRKGWIAMIGGLALGVAGISAKENAALTPLLALVIDYTLFQGKGERRHARTRSRFYLTVLGVPAVLALGYLWSHPQLISDSYATRDFTAAERLLTQPRVLWYYASLLLVPDVSRLGLFHDDIVVSHGLLTPPMTPLALAGWAALTIFVLQRRARYPVLAFAVLWFLAGHLLESSFIGLELVYEHRNYLPSLAPMAAVAIGLTQLLRRSDAKRRRLWPLALLVPLVLAFTTWRLSSAWADIVSLADHSARYHPQSPRAAALAASVNTANGNYADALRYLKHGQALAPNAVHFPIDTELLLTRLAVQISEQIAQDPPHRSEILQAYRAHLAPDVGVNEQGNIISLRFSSDHRERIPALLVNQPIDAGTMVALDELFQCVSKPPNACRGLSKTALVWFAIAADNPRAPAMFRAEVLANSARLYAAEHDDVRALAQARRAASMDPERPYYQLLLADQLLRSGHTDEASATLERLAHSDAKQLQPGGKHHDYLLQLLHQTAAGDKRS